MHRFETQQDKIIRLQSEKACLRAQVDRERREKVEEMDRRIRAEVYIRELEEIVDDLRRRIRVRDDTITKITSLIEFDRQDVKKINRAYSEDRHARIMAGN